ncbi:MAG: hypothetical protein JWQ87_948 [Candidatus Sulfotelmatobacter sp.]|nr:hypothetical protein [Candidatus Sulfotelmatobacter sp.]
MTTAEAIEKITDTGKFEILSIRALRELEEDCKSVIHLGMNAQGKTIPGPLDGFCLVPGCHPHRYVVVACTVTSLQKLESKWLSDRPSTGKPDPKPRAPKPTKFEKGDLIKAAKNAADIRAGNPTAEFVVYLCTNRRLDDELIKLTIAKASALGVEVRFLEQSRLRDFLDTGASGQWLRREHLGIEADLLCRLLLQEQSKRSLDGYAAEVILSSVQRIVPTKAEQDAYLSIRDPALCLHLLVGASGVGKSILAHSLLRRHIEDGGVGLWMPARVAETAISLGEGIGVVLRVYHPRLAASAGNEALALSTLTKPLLVVVDDINRTEDPSQLLAKIIGWSRLASKPANSGVAASTASVVRLVCPLWNSYWLSKQVYYDHELWLRSHLVGPMQRSESIACLKMSVEGLSQQFTNSEFDELAERMGDDAILLGLFGAVLKRDQSQTAASISADVIGHFVRNSLHELASQRGTIIEDYQSALIALATEMVHHKMLVPKWTDVQLWFDQDQYRLEMLRQLSHGSLNRITNQQDHSYFEFRHDRIREYFLSKAVSRLLDSAVARSALADPFFVPFVARAIVQQEIAGDALEWLATELPVALIESISFFHLYETPYLIRVLAKTRECLLQIKTVAPAVERDMLATLSLARSPRVLELTEGMSENEQVWFARLRNGDAVAGAKLLGTEFYPATQHSLIEALTDEAHARHGGKLVADLTTLLGSEDLDDSLRIGGLILAGYLGETSISSTVEAAWVASSDKRAVLLPALWATLRCAPEPSERMLRPMIDALLDLPDEGEFSERYSATQQVLFAIRHGLRDHILSYLTALGSQDEKYRWTILSLLYRTDHPVAVKFVSGELAALERNARCKGKLAPWPTQWKTQWKRDVGGNGSGLSEASLRELRNVWEEVGNPSEVKEYAFSVWVQYSDELPVLQSIPPESPSYRTAAWQRALRGDREIVPYVIEAANKSPGWFLVVPHLWCPELEAVLDSALSQLVTDSMTLPEPNVWDNAYHHFADVLRDIPADAGWRLLGKHWPGLNRVPLFVQVALYLSTPASRRLVDDAMAKFELTEEPLRHVSWFFGFTDSSRSNRLSESHLESLRPYIQVLPDTCLSSMLTFCRRYDHWSWALQHIKPECLRRTSKSPSGGGIASYPDRLAKGSFPSDTDLFTDLDEIEGAGEDRQPASLWFWLERFSERGDPSDRPFTVLKKWLQQSCPAPSSRLEIAAKAIGLRGKRSDLVLLPASNDGKADSEMSYSDARYEVMRRSLD